MRKIPRSQLPLVSSRKLTNALERLECYVDDSNRRGSHVPYYRDVDGRTLTAVVVLNKREIPRGTLQDILAGLAIDLEAFTRALR